MHVLVNGICQACPAVVRFDPLEKRDDHGRWSAIGAAIDAVEHTGRHDDRRSERLTKVGHDLFGEIESASSVDQVVEAMRRRRAAEPDLTTDDLIQAADAAIAAKYPPAQYPKIDGFYSKLLAGREKDIGRPLPAPKAKAVPKPRVPRKPPADGDYPKMTARTAQQMQDGLEPWTGDQRRALRYYTGNSTVANGLLRGWIKPPGGTAAERKKIEAAQRNIVHAKAAMRPATRAFTTYRTANTDQFGVATAKELHDLVGHTLTERGFISTSVKSGVGIGGKVKMEIEVPEGTHMAFVKSVSKYPYEDEILLPPGLKYTVVSVGGSAARPVVRVRVEAS